MNIASVSSASSALASAQTGDAVATLVAKKAMEIQAQTALQLLQSVPLPSGNNPANLGNSVDTHA